MKNLQNKMQIHKTQGMRKLQTPKITIVNTYFPNAQFTRAKTVRQD